MLDIILRNTALPLVMAIVSAALTFAGAADGQELVQAPKDTVFYELSKLRTEKGLSQDIVVFDYKRIREGSGSYRVHLAVRSDRGALRVQGLSIRIEKSGTIRLQDLKSRTRSFTQRDSYEAGFEFYFVLGEPVHQMFGGSGGKSYLVSNSLQHGEMSTKVSARPLTAAELMKAEQKRKASLPPQNVPEGYTRADANTVLIPGIPVMFGFRGKWKTGEIVSLPSTTSAKVMLEGSSTLITVRRDQ